MTDLDKDIDEQPTKVARVINGVSHMLSNYHTQAQKDELSQIVKENRQTMNDLWKERYGTDLEMNFYEGDE